MRITDSKLLVYAVPLLMLIVATIQLANTQRGLVRWKGGGYGMYSDYKPKYREVWVSNADTLFKVRSDQRPYGRIVTKIQMRPSDQLSTELVNAMVNKGIFVNKVEVYRPFVDPDQATLCKVKIYEFQQ